MAGVNPVFHCAAKVADWGSRRSFTSANVDGVRVIAEASAKAKVDRFVHVSSSDVYGFPGFAAIESVELKKRGFHYGDSKVDGERILWDHVQAKTLPATIIRPASVYGPGSITLVKDIVQLLRAGEMMYVGSGRTNAGLGYVGNVVDLIIRAAESEAAVGQAYNATDGSAVTWLEYVERLADLSGTPVPQRHIPYSLAHAAGWFMESVSAIRSWPSRPLITRMAAALFATDQDFPIGKARQELGFAPTVDFDEGMRRTEQWL